MEENLNRLIAASILLSMALTFWFLVWMAKRSSKKNAYDLALIAAERWCALESYYIPTTNLNEKKLDMHIWLDPTIFRSVFGRHDAFEEDAFSYIQNFMLKCDNLHFHYVGNYVYVQVPVGCVVSFTVDPEKMYDIGWELVKSELGKLRVGNTKPVKITDRTIHLKTVRVFH